MENTSEHVWALLAWTDHVVPGGAWSLSTMTDSAQQSGCYARWTEPFPPPLAERYDALASQGFAVVQGGPEAWRWREWIGDDGRGYLGALADIRPLTAADVLTDEELRSL